MVNLYHRLKVNGLKLVVDIKILFCDLVCFFFLKKTFLGDEFFTAVQEELGTDLPIVVEDLGSLTEDVFNLRDKFGLVGMRVVQFGFSYWPNDIYLPHNYIRNSIAYTGTHDNNTSSKYSLTFKTKKKGTFCFCCARFSRMVSS